MLTPEAAIERLRAGAGPLGAVEAVPLHRALGRVLAEAATSRVDVPPADNSAMDGYALRHGDWSGEATALRISQRVPAGRAPEPLVPGTAARLFTGAELPPGVDTVVMQEHCRGTETDVVIERCPDRGANVRPRAQDIKRGQEVLPAGQYLRPQDLGLLASVGMEEVRVRRRLRVAIVSNGDELVEPGRALAPGQIYNSNRYLLSGLMEDWGFVVLDRGIVPDDPEQIARTFGEAAEAADVIVSTGGVSVGEEDHVKGVVERLGSLALWKIAMKPGKPLAFGRIGATPFLGLPGNPASALVTAVIVARPLLFDLQGRRGAVPAPQAVPAGFDRAEVTRQEYLRVKLENGALSPYPNQSSGVLLSACWGDGLAVQPPGREIRSGTPLAYLSWASLR